MNFSQWLGFIVIAIALHILWQIRQLLSLFFAAVVIANGLNHLVKWFQDKGIRRSYGVLLSTGILLATIVGFFLIIVPPFTNQFPELIQLVSQGIEQLIISLKEFISKLDPEWILNFPNTQELTQQLRPLVNQIAGQGLSVFYNTIAIPLSLLLLLALTLMLLANPQPYRQGFIRLFPSFYRKKIDDILYQCDEALQGWLIGVLFDILVIALLSFLGLLALEIPLALSQAMLAGILAFIPNIGFVLSVVPPVAIALLESPWKSIIVIILYVSIHQIQTHFLNSLVIHKKISLLPALILLSQLFFTIIFGILGFFLALPLAVVSKVWLKEILATDILDVWQDKS
ncbi:MAG: AI-2E family transporter [cyanobacterium endosymbiont of Rhopalodia musculus]|uniref:AI-2E family transporter n=1 Tax=cyanobacterium endosymbiont of Epithemia clementina EcSB TaxID=3034674 RepID=UPI00247FA42D|nr:AI-2E family transporter [cyanobacterium endosymbiont of Epithemia clementina EcSB]WGT67820.1 AI-2E family transporter [cyanobacterium endosymbiont of Epithemia clementina EcSB]